MRQGIGDCLYLLCTQEASMFRSLVATRVRSLHPGIVFPSGTSSLQFVLAVRLQYNPWLDLELVLSVHPRDIERCTRSCAQRT